MSIREVPSEDLTGKNIYEKELVLTTPDTLRSTQHEIDDISCSPVGKGVTISPGNRHSEHHESISATTSLSNVLTSSEPSAQTAQFPIWVEEGGPPEADGEDTQGNLPHVPSKTSCSPGQINPNYLWKKTEQQRGRGQPGSSSTTTSGVLRSQRASMKRKSVAPRSVFQGLGLSFNLNAGDGGGGSGGTTLLGLPSVLSIENLDTYNSSSTTRTPVVGNDNHSFNNKANIHRYHTSMPMSPLVQDRRYLEQEWARMARESRMGDSSGGGNSSGHSFPSPPSSPKKNWRARDQPSRMPSRKTTRSLPNLANQSSTSFGDSTDHPIFPKLIQGDEKGESVCCPTQATVVPAAVTGKANLNTSDCSSTSHRANRGFGAASPQCSATPVPTEVSSNSLSSTARAWKPKSRSQRGDENNVIRSGESQSLNQLTNGDGGGKTAPLKSHHDEAQGCDLLPAKELSLSNTMTESGPLGTSGPKHKPWRGSNPTPWTAVALSKSASARTDFPAQLLGASLNYEKKLKEEQRADEEDEDESAMAITLTEEGWEGGSASLLEGPRGVPSIATGLPLETTVPGSVMSGHVTGVGDDDCDPSIGAYRVGELGAFVTNKVANHQAEFKLTDDGEGGTYFVKIIPAAVLTPPTAVPHSPSSGVTSKLRSHRLDSGSSNSLANPGGGGHHPPPSSSSFSGGKIVAVFKPKDEEIGCEGNPRGNNVLDRLGFEPGEGYIREQLAWELDHDHFAGVPETTIVTLAVKSTARQIGRDGMDGGSALQIGSLQRFIPSTTQSWDMGPGKFSVEEVHRVGIFDIRVLNGDRHGGNLLVPKGDSTLLVPIDHSYILPAGFADPEFEWKDWPQSRLPFSTFSLDYIAHLDKDLDEQLVKDRLSAEAGETIATTTSLLQTAAPRGYTLSDMADYCRRQHITRPSQLEQLMADSRDSSTLGIDMPSVMRRLNKEFPVKGDKSTESRKSSLSPSQSPKNPASGQTRDWFGVDSDSETDGDDDDGTSSSEEWIY